jgi:hypothetical protein
MDPQEDFIRKIHAAYQALAEVRCHALCGPGIKGLQEELLELTGISHVAMMEAVCPGWPEPSPEVGAPVTG